MKVNEIVEVLDGTLIIGGNDLDLEITSACGADLMSDVMAFVKDHVVLLTGLVNPQVIRTAEMMDIKVVVFVRGKTPDQLMLDLADSKGITLIATKDPLFIACGKLYSAGLVGRGVRD